MTRECVTHLLTSFHDTECFDDRWLWQWFDINTPATMRTYARRLSSFADYRVALAERRREQLASKRRGTCEPLRTNGCTTALAERTETH